MVDSWDVKYGEIDSMPMRAIRSLLVNAERVATEEATLGICFSLSIARRVQPMVSSVVTDVEQLAFQLAGKKAKNVRPAGKVVA
jgi:hypothetical protein